MIKKISFSFLIFICIILLQFQFVFSVVTYNNTEVIKWTYDVVNVTMNNKQLVINSVLASNNTPSLIHNIPSCPDTGFPSPSLPQNFCYIFAYLQSGDYKLSIPFYNSMTSSNTINNFDFHKYRDGNDLDGNQCIVEIDNDSIKSNLHSFSDYASSIGRYEFINTNMIFNFENKLKNNYYMKTQVTYTLKNSSGDIIDTTESLIYIKPEGNTLSNPFTKDVIKNNYADIYGFGDYNVSVKAKPIDMKCDFYGNGLTSAEAPSTDETHLTTINIPHPDLLTIDEDSITGFWERIDDYFHNKIRYNRDERKAKFIKKDNSEHEIILPIEDPNKYIKIIRDGVNVRNDTIKPEIIALNLHQIKKVDDATEAKEFIDKSFDVMTKLNITKDLEYNSFTSKTNIKIKLDIPYSEQINLTVYQVIPKEIAQDINQINFISNGSGKMFILDKDPIIGWYFNESQSNEEIIFEIPGNNEGGTIIITQEPILYNEGELIVIYREKECNNDEAFLFEIDDLSHSAIYTPNSNKLYNICVGHTTQNLNNNTNNLFMHIFNYTNEGNLSFMQELTNSVHISVQNITPIYWDMQIQKNNPSGTYSCLGSIINEENSTFGDCGFNPDKRIWMYLGKDNIPPTTKSSISALGHTRIVSLNATDIGGSAVKDTFYCIIDESNCDFKPYNKPFAVTCPFEWGCLKTIKFYSTDNAGNYEDEQIQEVILIDAGSSCQPDCTAKPSPNRILKECRNLNGCEFFASVWETGDDIGLYVANQCDYTTSGAWTKFNTTHEIMCPQGPLRKSRFTIERLFYHNSFCDYINVIPYVAFIDGEQVKMNIIHCTNID